MPPGLRRLQSANEGSDELLSCLVRVSRESKTLSSFPMDAADPLGPVGAEREGPARRR